MNIAIVLANAAKAFAERPAVCLGRKTVHSYAQLLQRSAALGEAFRGRGFAPGSRVGVFLSNRPEYFEILFGAWFAGLVVAPINAKLHPKELAYIIENCAASVLFTDIEGGLSQPGNVVDVDGDDYRAMLATAPSDCLPASVGPEDTAWLFYTSGTTGYPKGAMLTHRNLYNMTTSFLADIGAVDETDAALYPAPLSHGAGLLALAHLVRGAANVVPESGGFQPDEIVDLINRFPGSSFFAAPTMVNRLVTSPSLANLKVENLDQIFYGGAPMYVEDLKRALSVLGPRLWQAYGQGESPCTISYLPPHMHLDIGDGRLDERLSSVGITRTGVCVRVVDAEGNDVPPGENGEVIVAGDVVMAGYWNNPSATAQALRDGWLWTGDIGTFDMHGFLYLKDRSKDVIISGGSNIYPREVEEVLLRHPAVTEVSVIGRRHPDWGEEVVAFVASSTPVTAEELDAFCIDHIARFKRPKSYRFLPNLPKSNYGKILKTEIRKLIESETTASPGEEQRSA
ncbi:long-chain acyl-CoA synthetase [Bradyrhizobium sp. JR1.5]|uniref:class I adenylate-forming enzyme family protein n=1 Tax=unclassified Bradyrhizobium TaxID=2631580 RepID=UPI0033917462